MQRADLENVHLRTLDASVTPPASPLAHVFGWLGAPEPPNTVQGSGFRV